MRRGRVNCGWGPVAQALLPAGSRLVSTLRLRTPTMSRRECRARLRTLCGSRCWTRFPSSRATPGASASSTSAATDPRRASIRRATSWNPLGISLLGGLGPRLLLSVVELPIVRSSELRKRRRATGSRENRSGDLFHGGENLFYGGRDRLGELFYGGQGGGGVHIG